MTAQDMTAEALPFPFPVDVGQLPAGGRVYTLNADQAQREAVARHLELTALARLVGKFTIEPKAGGVEVKGRFEADLTQACVITLQPLPATVTGDIQRHYATPTVRKPSGKGKEAEKEGPSVGWIDPDEDVPDPIVDGTIDLGALVVEELALHVDPYPRAPGASFQPLDTDKDAEKAAEAAPSGPFAALAGLKTGPQPRGRRAGPRDTKARRK